jgi:hypothetical protein
MARAPARVSPEVGNSVVSRLWRGRGERGAVATSSRCGEGEGGRGVVGAVVDLDGG